MLRIFIGYDERESIAYHVLSHSIIKYTSVPVSITPLVRKTLPIGHRDAKASTDFADTRFLVPWLSNYEGWSLFIDADMVFTFDVKKVFDMAEEQYSVMVVKHDHKPEEATKFLGAAQYQYNMKNWSSMMLFNNANCKKLTPAYVNMKMAEQKGLDLHQFTWCELCEIGEIPKGWNYLAGYDDYDLNGTPYMIHYTEGTPCFPDYRKCDLSEVWHALKKEMEHCES